MKPCLSRNALTRKKKGKTAILETEGKSADHRRETVKWWQSPKADLI